MSRTYKTVQGDKWDVIAHTQCGNVSYTDKLMVLNQQYLGYYIFPAGIVLTLPEPVVDSPSDALPPWKRVSS